MKQRGRGFSQVSGTRHSYSQRSHSPASQHGSEDGSIFYDQSLSQSKFEPALLQFQGDNASDRSDSRGSTREGRRVRPVRPGVRPLSASSDAVLQDTMSISAMAPFRPTSGPPSERSNSRGSTREGRRVHPVRPGVRPLSASSDAVLQDILQDTMSISAMAPFRPTSGPPSERSDRQQTPDTLPPLEQRQQDLGPTSRSTTSQSSRRSSSFRAYRSMSLSVMSPTQKSCHLARPFSAPIHPSMQYEGDPVDSEGQTNQEATGLDAVITAAVQQVLGERERQLEELRDAMFAKVEELREQQQALELARQQLQEDHKQANESLIGSQLQWEETTVGREAQLEAREAQLEAREAQLDAREAMVAGQELAMASREISLAAHGGDVANREAEIANHEAELAQRQAGVAHREAEVAHREAEIARREADIASREIQVAGREADMASREAELATTKAQLAERQVQLATWEAETSTRHAILQAQQEELTKEQKEIVAHMSVAEKETRVKERAAHLDALNEQLKGLGDLVQRRQEDMARMEEEMQQRKAKLAKDEAEIVARLAEVDRRELEAKDTEERLAAAQVVAVANLQRIAKKSTELMGNVSAQAEEMEKTVEAKADALHERLEALMSDLQQRWEANDHLEAQIQEQLAEIKTQEAHLASMKENLDQQAVDLDSKAQQLAQGKLDLAESRSKFNEDCTAQEQEFKEKTDQLLAEEQRLQNFRQTLEQQEIDLKSREATCTSTEAQQQQQAEDIARQVQDLGQRETEVRAAEQRAAALSALEHEREKALQDLLSHATLEEERLAQLTDSKQTMEQDIAKMQDRKQHMEEYESKLREREQQVEKLEAVLRRAQTILDHETEAALQKLADREQAVEVREIELSRRQHELSILLSKERLLERTRMQTYARNEMVLFSVASAAAHRKAIADIYGGSNSALPSIRKGGKGPPSPREEGGAGFVLLDAEARLGQFSQKLYNCLHHLKRCYDKAFSLVRSSGRSEAHQEFLNELQDRGMAYMVAQGSSPDVTEDTALAELTTLYREGKQQLEEMVAVLRSADLSLFPTPSLPAHSAVHWPTEAYVVEPMLGSHSAAALFMGADHDAESQARKAWFFSTPETNANPRTPMKSPTTAAKYPKKVAQPKKLPALQSSLNNSGKGLLKI